MEFTIAKPENENELTHNTLLRAIGDAVNNRTRFERAIADLAVVLYGDDSVGDGNMILLLAHMSHIDSDNGILIPKKMLLDIFPMCEGQLEADYMSGTTDSTGQPVVYFPPVPHTKGVPLDTVSSTMLAYVVCCALMCMVPAKYETKLKNAEPENSRHRNNVSMEFWVTRAAWRMWYATEYANAELWQRVVQPALHLLAEYICTDDAVRLFGMQDVLDLVAMFKSFYATLLGNISMEFMLLWLVAEVACNSTMDVKDVIAAVIPHNQQLMLTSEHVNVVRVLLEKKRIKAINNDNGNNNNKNNNTTKEFLDFFQHLWHKDIPNRIFPIIRETLPAYVDVYPCKCGSAECPRCATKIVTPREGQDPHVTSLECFVKKLEEVDLKKVKVQREYPYFNKFYVDGTLNPESDLAKWFNSFSDPTDDTIRN